MAQALNNRMRLIDLYHADMADQSSTEARQYVRNYWYRAVGVTLWERFTWNVPDVPKTGTRGTRVERFIPFWEHVADVELTEVLKHLGPYYVRHSETDLS
jgi:hypothetical protein